MHSKFQNLVEIAAQLRAEGGCPWDREQTIASMVPRVTEEAQEIQEALEKKDWENLEEELGDVLFNLVMIAQIAKEEKKFNIDGVLEKITEKLISRHTWVFGEEKASTAEEALELWIKNKAKEKESTAQKAKKKV
jgi:MazG family protein